MNKNEKRGSDVYEEIQNHAKKLIEAVEKNEDIESSADSVIKDIGRIEVEDVENRQKFQEIERKLKDIGSSTALSRHRRTVKEYNSKTAEFKKHLDALKEAERKRSSPEHIKQKSKDILDYLEKNQPKKEYHIKSTESRLPWRVVQPGELQLLGDASAIPGPVSTSTGTASPAADDLSPTIDVQITPEIQALAKSLNNRPLEILRHVYNNYRFTPYYGSMKGSLDTYWEKEGNDYDLASLLIALLRASNVPARYVKAKIMVPIDRITGWLGIKDPMAALQYLSSAKIPFGYYVQGGAISQVQLEHVYVEAFVPYSNYRGTGEDASGKVWIPMDPSFKQENILQEGTDIASGMGIDWKAFSDDYFSALRNETPKEFYLDKVNQYLARTYPGKTIDALKRTTEIKKMLFDFLPNTLQYSVTEVLGRFPDIPQEQRHTLRFSMPQGFDYATSLPEVAGRRITLTFVAATPDDQAVIDQFGNIFNTPPYLIQVKPQLKMNGTTVAEGSPMNCGIIASLSVAYTQPGGQADTFNHSVTTGSYNAVGITVGKVRPETASIANVEESAEPYLPKMLHSLVMKYHDNLNQMRQILNDTMKIKSKTFFTEALVSTRENTSMSSWGIPMTFDLAGYTIDAKEMSTAIIAVDGYDKNKAINFAMIQGHEASYQENATFEGSMFWLSGLSAVKGILLLKAMGITVEELPPHATYANPDLSQTVIDDINNALNMGWKVTVPIETGGLPVFPYIKYDPATGSAGYMIASAAGGFASVINPVGHEIDLTFIKDLFLNQSGVKLSFAILSPPSPYLVAMREAFGAVLRTTAEMGTPGSANYTQSTTETPLYIDTDWTHYPVGQWPLYALLPGEFRYKFDGNDLLVFDVWGVSITEIKTPCDNSNVQNTCNHSFTAWSLNGGLGDTISIKAQAYSPDANSQIAWTCRTAPGAIDGGSCESTTMFNGTNFLFTPNPPAAPNGRTGPLSYEITASITYNGATTKDTVTISQDKLDELRQEYLDMPGRTSQDRDNFDTDSAVHPFERLLDAPDIENNRFDRWHILRLNNLNQHATDVNHNYTSGVLRVTAGYRTPRGNALAGGEHTSNHQYGIAIDFNQQDSLENYYAFDAAVRAGAGRDSYLKAEDANYYYFYFLTNGMPPRDLPVGRTYVQGHVAW